MTTNKNKQKKSTTANKNTKNKTNHKPSKIVFKLPTFILDITLIIALLICTIYLLSIISPLNLLPPTWIYLGVSLIIIIALVHIILGLIKQPLIINILRRIFIIVLCPLLIFASTSIQIVDKAVDEVIKLPTSYKEYVSIITLKNSALTNINDIISKPIGVQGSIDTDHMNLAQKNIEDKTNKKLSSKVLYTYQDYGNAVDALYSGKVSSIVMSEVYRDLIEESYPDFKEKTSIIDAVEIETPIVDIVNSIDVTTNTFTVLISGIDTLGKATITSNSDVTMLITVNPLTKTIVMNSIPRDSYLPNACMNNGYDKLTHTGYKGVDCTIKTIEHAFGVTVNYYAKVTFSSLINIVNALGGIEIDVPMTFCERRANRSGIMYINKGPQTLNGEQALALARHRYTLKNGDLGRAANQQLVINAIIKKALNIDILNKVSDLINVVGETVQTNITKKEIYDFTNMLMQDLSTPWTMSNHVVKGTSGWGVCASIPNMELSIVELSEDDVNKVKYVIKSAESDADLSEFTFNINGIKIVDVSDQIENSETTGAEGGNYCHLAS